MDYSDPAKSSLREQIDSETPFLLKNALSSIFGRLRSFLKMDRLATARSFKPNSASVAGRVSPGLARRASNGSTKAWYSGAWITTRSSDRNGYTACLSHFALRSIAMSQNTLERIRAHLNAAGVTFREVEHEPTRTSEESAAARGEDLSVGAKALLLRTDNSFRLFVLPADRKLDSSAIRRQLGVRKTRFATVQELHELTGLTPGAVPPFGEPILPFELYADEALGAETNKVAFNAGSLNNSIIMKALDWAAVARPNRFRFAKK